MIQKLIVETLTPEQQEVIGAIDKLYISIRERGKLTQSDISLILSDIKSLNKLYGKAFNKPAFSWQVDYYSLQMALENEYRFIFMGDDRMTWTQSRWRFAIETELAILYYNKGDGGVYTVQETHGFLLMCLWIFFQFFKAYVFDGPECGKVLTIAFEIVKNADKSVREFIQGIRQWRKNNHGNIEHIKSCKSMWSREKGRMKRLVYGRMKVKDVEWYHIVYWSQPQLSFESNMRSASFNLGVSVSSLKKIIRSFKDVDKNNFRGYVYVHMEEAEKLYEEEQRWAQRVLSNTLTKKERKQFWRKFSIPEPRRLFRTFTSPEEDIIPADNPLLTTDERPNREGSFLNIYSANNRFEPMWDPMRSPLKSSPNSPGMIGYVSPFDSPDLFRFKKYRDEDKF